MAIGGIVVARGVFLAGAVMVVQGCGGEPPADLVVAGGDASTGSGSGNSAPPSGSIPGHDGGGASLDADAPCESGSGAPGDAADVPDASGACAATFPAVTDFGARGTFAIKKDDGTTIASLGTAGCTVYRPSTLGEGGRHHPVIVWGNGTGTPTVIVYEWLFNQWASHGFIVAAANTSSAGTGKEMIACLDWVEAQNSVAGSPYQGHVSIGNAASSGHSQGGGGAIMAGRDPRFRATVPFMAYTQGLGHDAASQSEQHGPMLLMSGGQDTIAPPDANQRPVFQSSNVPTFWGILAGADHVTFALGGIKGYLAPSTAWLRLHLMCDESARPMFYGASCTLCKDASWTVQRKSMP